MVILTEDKLLRHELIHLKVSVLRSSNPLQVGISGVVVDETKNMLVIANTYRKKSIPKEGSTYRFALRDGLFIDVEGKKLLGRSAERIRKNWRK